MYLISIGSDMEVFAQNKVGHHVALCGMIGGTKEEPKPIPSLGDGFMIQEDNVAAEFNIPVCYRKSEFVNSMSIMREHITKVLKSLDLQLSPNSSFSFADAELHHPNALVFGCEPDYDAWKMIENAKPQANNPNLRTCGGHIHVGSNIDLVQGIKNMDLFLGVPSVLVDDSPSSVARRELYGKAGATRPKPYGFEYRVLSNFWMFNDNLVAWVYDQTNRACNFGHAFNKKEEQKIIECINTGNKDYAKELMDKFEILLPA